MKRPMPKPKLGLPRLFTRRGTGFARDERGVTAVEFGLLALPFFALLSATMETALVFLASNVFESALHDSTRMIRTGQVHEIENYDTEDFRTELCERGYGLFQCDQIKVRVRTITSFQAANVAEPIDPDTAEWVIAEEFDPGIRKSIVIAEAYYKWDTLIDIMGFNLTNSADGTFLMGAARVWRNEPF